MFDPAAYGGEVAAILALDGNGERAMPLVRGACNSVAREHIAKAKVPELARAGLYLYFGCWDEAHEVAQNIESAEGSYWHGIVHRQEPDAGNAGYWFRRVGQHPIFPALRDQAAEIGVDFGARWYPIRFISYCERPENASQALEVQRAEWQLLFDHCAR